MATVAGVLAGLAGSWYIAELPSDDAARAPSAHATDVERMLVDRTVAALAFGETDVPLGAALAEPPPTAIIPDLSSEGFTFTGAEARGVSPKSVVLPLSQRCRRARRRRRDPRCR